MTNTPKKKVDIAGATETLLNFAVDRNDMRLILDGLPEGALADRGKIEYEIQIMKILMVGWSLSFFMQEAPLKKPLTESYWFSVQAFSKQLSEATSSAIEKEFDYFAVLRERLNTYLNVLDKSTEKKDPSVVIGPLFATVCGEKDNTFIVLAGSKMFNLAVGGVRHYLNSLTMTLPE